jgi:hypothetical protein
MNKKIADLLDKMSRTGNERYVSVQIANMAELLSILADEQAQSADKMERQTNKMISMTRVIVILTAGLLAYTAVLCFLTIKLTQ